MVFVGILCKIMLKYSKKVLDYKVKKKNKNLYYNKSYNES